MRKIFDSTRFYESPFTDIDEAGIGGVFDLPETRKNVSILRFIDATATPGPDDQAIA